MCACATPTHTQAVLTRSATDVLSHAAIRARAQRVLLATCFDAAAWEEIKAAAGGCGWCMWGCGCAAAAAARLSCMFHATSAMLMHLTKHTASALEFKKDVALRIHGTLLHGRPQHTAAHRNTHTAQRHSCQE